MSTFRGRREWGASDAAVGSHWRTVLGPARAACVLASSLLRSVTDDRGGTIHSRLECDVRSSICDMPAREFTLPFLKPSDSIALWTPVIPPL